MTREATRLDVRAGLAAVLARVDRACARAGRSPGEVRLVAVTKTVAPERVRELLSAGHRILGENKVQEALAKQAQLGPGPEWHFIGRLQRNKARSAAGAFRLIHSVDSLRLAADLDRHCAEAGIRQAVLLQVNLAHEPTKGGVDEAELPECLDGVAAKAHLDLRGLMTVPPPAAAPEQSAPWFRRLRELRDAARSRVGLALPELSMGMTDDFEVAIAEGATLIRVGRAIFGDRPVT